MSDYYFVTTCVDIWDPDLLTPMIEQARQITYRTARRHLGEALDIWAAEQGYSKHYTQGLLLCNDRYVDFNKSTFDGWPCIYIRWSAIENIFVKGPYERGKVSPKPFPYRNTLLPR